jgi:SAM-dependent methyltransferase
LIGERVNSMDKGDEPDDDSFFVNHLPFRSRGLAQVETRVGPIRDLIRFQIATKGPRRVLEVGYGFGALLVDLALCYGDGVILTGLSDATRWGGWDVIHRAAVATNRATEIQLESMIHPTLVTHDANTPLPFQDNSFDLILTQVTFYYLAEKAQFIEEVHRVLAPGGIALLDIQPITVDGTSLPLFRIVASGTPVDVWPYLGSFRGIDVHKTTSGYQYLRITKTHNGDSLNLGLRLISSFNMQVLNKEYVGISSDYVLAIERTVPPPRS